MPHRLSNQEIQHQLDIEFAMNVAMHDGQPVTQSLLHQVNMDMSRSVDTLVGMRRIPPVNITVHVNTDTGQLFLNWHKIPRQEASPPPSIALQRAEDIEAYLAPAFSNIFARHPEWNGSVSSVGVRLLSDLRDEADAAHNRGAIVRSTIYLRSEERTPPGGHCWYAVPIEEPLTIWGEHRSRPRSSDIRSAGWSTIAVPAYNNTYYDDIASALISTPVSQSAPSPASVEDLINGADVPLTVNLEDHLTASQMHERKANIIARTQDRLNGISGTSGNRGIYGSARVVASDPANGTLTVEVDPVRPLERIVFTSAVQNYSTSFRDGVLTDEIGFEGGDNAGE